MNLAHAEYRSTAPAVWLASVALLALSGCNGSETGASYEPTVTMRPDALVAGDASDTDNGQTKAGGDQTPEVQGLGTLAGQVVFVGQIPQLPQLVPTKDLEVCKPYANQSLIVNPQNKGVKNVFIWIERLPKTVAKTPVPEQAATFDQKACQFVPHAQLLRAKQTIKVLSDDPIAHNTHTYPSRADVFNSTVQKDREGKTQFAYNRAEKSPVRIGCDFHGWMEAWQLPLDHSYAALTDADGRFVLGGTPENPESGLPLPAGKYKLQIWHEAAGSGASNNRFLVKNQSVTITANQQEEIKINYQASRVATN
jgi:hypothetical protein